MNIRICIQVWLNLLVKKVLVRFRIGLRHWQKQRNLMLGKFETGAKSMIA